MDITLDYSPDDSTEMTTQEMEAIAYCAARLGISPRRALTFAIATLVHRTNDPEFLGRWRAKFAPFEPN